MSYTCRFILTVWFALIGVAACADLPTGVAVQDNNVVLLAASDDPCEKEWHCGGNSPVLDVGGIDMGFHDLNLLGYPNQAGLTIDGGARPQIVDSLYRSWDLAIVDSRIIGRQGNQVLEKKQLEGATIQIDSDGQLAATLRIDRVRTFNFPFGDTSEELEAYVLAWSPAGQEDFGNLCANPPFELDARSVHVEDSRIVADPAFPPSIVPRYWQVPWYVRQVVSQVIVGDPKFVPPPPPWQYPELLGMEPEEALVYAGDRIDAQQKTMSLTEDPAWFNIGCAGHTVAKLHLTRNTLASQHKSGPIANWNRRQATLKLLTADYCGHGRAFTVPGVPLQWRGHDDDAKNSFFKDMMPVQMEAWWTAEGAVCLNELRLANGDYPKHPEHYPSLDALRKDINATCRRILLPCDDQFDPDEIRGEVTVERVSANPDIVRETCMGFEDLASEPGWHAGGGPDKVTATAGWNGTIYDVPITTERLLPPSLPLGAEVAFPDPSTFGTDVSLGLKGARLRFDLGKLPAPRRAIRFDFFDLPITGRPENIAIDDLVSLGDLSSGFYPISDTYLSITTTPAPGGGTRGTVFLAPLEGINTLKIGGERLWIDRVCVLQ